MDCRALKDEAGLTLVELMVAAFVLVVGMLGALTMLERGLATTALDEQRVAATNLGRELVENARAADYDRLSADQVAAALQAKPDMGSGTPWRIVRGRTTFTVTATACTFDDPADGLAAVPPPGRCQA